MGIIAVIEQHAQDHIPAVNFSLHFKIALSSRQFKLKMPFFQGKSPPHSKKLY
jgi:hypothetical protein